MRISRWVPLVVSAVLAGMCELSFVSFFGQPIHAIRPILVGVVLMVVLGRPRHALIFAAISGGILDLFPVDGSTASSLRFLVIATTLIMISQTVLTNRSVYATALLMVAARIMDRLWIFGAALASRYLLSRAMSVEAISSLGWTLAWDIGMVSIAFVLLAVFTRRFMIAPQTDPRSYVP